MAAYEQHLQAPHCTLQTLHEVTGRVTSTATANVAVKKLRETYCCHIEHCALMGPSREYTNAPKADSDPINY